MNLRMGRKYVSRYVPICEIINTKLVSNYEY